jgi:predicted 2-oxoglutarate/Fe(II)-dependent dioxygenase YbiX/peroxiredoxin
MPPEPGTPAPQFSAPSPSNPNFGFGSLGGLYVLLVFLPAPGAERDAAVAAIRAQAGLFHDENSVVFGVLPDRESFEAASNAEHGLRWFGDFDGEIGRLFGTSAGGTPQWWLIDPMLRIMMRGPLAAIGEALAALRSLPPAHAHAGAPLTAPVLTVPRILEAEFCRELIACYERQGGGPSGVMRVIDGKTVGVLDGFKSRRDAQIPPGPLQDALRTRVAARLAPEIVKAFNWRPTHIERYIVACYDAAEDGRFRPHRDNTTPATAHRRFAVSINLNDDFDGGDLRFPEFGPRTYRPPPGGAVVFSCSLLHEASRVTRGRRFATLPFLYDVEGARIRAANAPSLAATPGPAAG